MTDTLASLQPKDVQLDEKLLKKTFLEHLNYIYFGKQQLLAFFTEVEKIATLNVLKPAITECSSDTGRQLQNLGDIYTAIEETPSKTSTLSIKATMLEGYLAAIRKGRNRLEKDVFILFYLQQIEGIEITYFKVLKNLAKAIGYSNSFLDQPFDLAVENRVLFEAIYKEYIN